MSAWSKTVVLKDLLTDDGSDEATRTAAAGFVRRLTRLSEYEDDFELRSIVDEFDDIADPTNDPNTLGGTLCDYFNEVLAAFYDWADANRVWIGGTR